MGDDNKKQHFKNLLSIALSDGILDKKELEFLFEKSDKYYITMEEIETVVDNSMYPSSMVISDKSERGEKMLELIEMMLLDGEAHEHEERLCMIFGVSLGYAPEKINDLIEEASNLINEGSDKAAVLSAILKYE